jgi:hypothetical protein
MARTMRIGAGAAGAASAAAAVLLAVVAARADLVEWEVDEAQSQIELIVPDQVVMIDALEATIRLRNQSGGDAGPWTVGNLAAVGGTIATDYQDGVSIAFLSGQHDLFGLVSGSYRPNPAVFDPGLANAENPDGQFADATPADGVYGARVRATVSIFTLDAAFINFTDVLYDIFSLTLPIAAGSFDAGGLDMGFAFATVAFDGLTTFVGQPIPDAQGTPIIDVFGMNLDPGATITSPDPMQPDLRRLTLPVDLDLVVEIGGVLLDASAVGTIVAETTLPEPGGASMLGSGALLLALLDRRRRGHPPLRRRGARASACT